jgi:hypothetical protein
MATKATTRLLVEIGERPLNLRQGPKLPTGQTVVCNVSRVWETEKAQPHLGRYRRETLRNVKVNVRLKKGDGE